VRQITRVPAASKNEVFEPNTAYVHVDKRKFAIYFVANEDENH
jgi:hypothetical protein